MDEAVILYRGDKNVEIQFTIKNNPFRYKTNIEETFGQLVIKRKNADSIFSNVSQLSSGRILFVFTADMIDELSELGSYTFQIRLFNKEKTSRGTLPEVVDGILIKKPICDGEDPAKINEAIVNEAYANEGKPEIAFDEGHYNRTQWVAGDIITDAKLNKIEDAIGIMKSESSEYVTDVKLSAKIDEINHNINEIDERAQLVEEDLANSLGQEVARLESELNAKAYKEELPTKVSQLENDAKYITKIPDEYVTEAGLDEYITYNELKDFTNTHIIGSYVTQQELKDTIGDIDSILDEINGEEI